MNTFDMAVFMNHWPGFLSIRDSNHRFTYLNQNFLDWLYEHGITKPLGKTGPELASQAPPNVSNMLNTCHDASLEYLDTGVCLPKIIEFKAKSGIQHFNVIKFKAEVNGKTRIFTTGFDVTKLHQTAEFYQLMSQTDPLTGLNNKEALKRYDAKKGIAIVIDLNNFKLVNDELGHLQGDKVLESFAKMLKSHFREKDFIARIGGDEFLVISSDLSEQGALHRLDTLAGNFQINFAEYENLGWAYGVASFEDDWENTFAKADKAMYDNKKRSKI